MRVIFALFCLFCCLPALAAPPAVVIVLLPPATLQDWQNADAPTLHRLMQTGSLAVMNTRVAHQAGRSEAETPQAALLTLGAGARAAGTAVTARFWAASSAAPGINVSAAALFERRTGTAAQPGQSVCLDWPAVADANRSVGYDLSLGNLSDTLNAHGFSVAAGGGVDADWLAVSSSGTVQRVSELRAAPGLCLIWAAGPDLKSADSVLENAASQVTALQGHLVALSPQAENTKDRQLAPVLAWRSGVPPGLLSSPSTRRPGLVTNTDLAPSVAALFGISRSGFHTLPFGLVWSPVPSSNSAGDCERLNREAVQQSQAMRLLPYAAAGLGFWVLAASVLVPRIRLPNAVFLVPLATLAAALIAVSALSFGLNLLGLLVAAATLLRYVSFSRCLTTVCAAIALALCADMVTGNTLMHRGLLGYSALEGARYYGIGNEAMGLLLGASLICVGSWWQLKRLPQTLLIAMMAGVVILLGSAGAKAGGVLVSLAVFGTFLFSVTEQRWSAGKIAALVAIVAVGMAVVTFGDTFLHAGSRSHIGEAVARISAGGMGEAGDIVRRKLTVEGRLAYHSGWALLLWLGLGCTVRLWKTTSAGRFDAALRSAGTAGLLACLLLNDAGVVAAAIFGVFLWTAAVAQKISPPVLDVSKSEGRID